MDGMYIEVAIVRLVSRQHIVTAIVGTREWSILVDLIQHPPGRIRRWRRVQLPYEKSSDCGSNENKGGNLQIDIRQRGFFMSTRNKARTFTRNLNVSRGIPQGNKRQS